MIPSILMTMTNFVWMVSDWWLYRAIMALTARSTARNMLVFKKLFLMAALAMIHNLSKYGLKRD
ncbi:hypothetical protein THIOM_003029 [Candidatus Thiomargarita nelsonii]|uniref:Uncharacterized protein n=1 Tax=Candidatus Thiomargarita nelsonii TaxID=1003181 RepID=A0A176RZX0_9GAMM|nr:hypothetical protein THIOM_003029 [Candidatus Thiomargarita nelsonii]